MNRGSRPSRPTACSSGRLQASLTNGVPAPLWTIDFRNPDAPLGQWNDSSVTFGRGSSGTYISDTGLVTTASASVMRPEYSPTSLHALGVLLEQAAQNAQPHSEAFTLGSAWAQTNISRNSTTELSPAGTNTALRVTATAANATLQGLAQSAVRVVSIYLRRVSGTGAVQINSHTGQLASEWVTVPIDSVWRRFQLPPRNNARLAIRITASGDSIEVWGAQNELSSTAASSYIATAAAALARQPDVAYAEFSNIALWGGRVTQRGSMSVEILKRAQRIGSAGAGTMIALQNNPDAFEIGMTINGWGTGSFNGLAFGGIEPGTNATSNAVSDNAINTAIASMKPDQTVKSAISWNLPSIQQCDDGRLATRMTLAGSFGAQWNTLHTAFPLTPAGGVYVRCSFWPEPLNEDQLRAVTA